MHVDNLTDSNAIYTYSSYRFLIMLTKLNMSHFPLNDILIHLDLTIASANSILSPTVMSLPISPTDHFAIIMFVENY